LSVVSDRKLFQNTLSFTTFAPDVLSYSDYYPFGMLVPNRHASSNSYRYGFQGQEKDDEIKGEGNSINYTFRMHDPRVGRFFAVDPLTSKYPWYSPYQFSGNKVIQFVELEGLEEGASASLSANANVSASVTLGGKGKTHFSLGFGGSIMANMSVNAVSAQLSLNGSLNYSNGGLTASGGNRTSNGMFESVFTPAVTIGALEKNTPLMNVNYLHGNATTDLQNSMKYSFMWALNYHNGTDNTNQKTATYGIRIGAFSLNILEDHHAWLGADGFDRYWTGSSNMNWMFNDGSVLTFGSDVYTGNSKNDKSTPEDLNDTDYGGKTGWPFGGKDFYWANQFQNDVAMGLPLGHNQSLNNSQTYLQISNSTNVFRLTTTGPASFWSQTTIHNAFSPAFHHFKSADSKNRIELTIGKR
jgi:RHS repeat-associated protein